MNKLLLFLFRRQYRKKLLNAARDIALGRQDYMCLAIGNLRHKLPMFNQAQFRVFINKRYPELVQYLEERDYENFPWFNLEASAKAVESKEFKFLLHWAKSEYLEWIAYNL